jgi:hypothetical protein
MARDVMYFVYIDSSREVLMAKRRKSAAKVDGRSKKQSWSKDDHRELKRHSKAKTPVSTISRLLKRTDGALRQQARKLGIALGHRR